MNKAIIIAFTGLLLAGCGTTSNNTPNTSHLKPADLKNTQYTLISYNGKAVAGEKTLAFSDDLRVSGMMCNNFMGLAELSSNILTVKQMVSTRKLCADEQSNQLDAVIGRILEAGASVSQNQNALTLTGVDHILIYRKKS